MRICKTTSLHSPLDAPSNQHIRFINVL
uniref:Uncharacterized protein n=1 Tax=Rhizophora mucronata TaxID=61149 RepID=A0A2P2N5W0_RHIMU